MAKKRTVTYECEQCGSEIVVTSTGEGELSPIYCCGIEVTETAVIEEKVVRPKKKAAKSLSGKKSRAKKSTRTTKKKTRK